MRRLAIECISRIEINQSDLSSDECDNSTLIESIMSRLILYLDDPYIELRPILIGKYVVSISICKFCQEMLREIVIYL